MTKRFVLALFASLSLIGLVAVGVAHATSPGNNGKIAFALNERLFTINADDSGLTQVPTSCEALEPDWAPDGRTIAFIGRCGPSGSFDLRAIDVNGTGLRDLYATNADDARIDWSPDGSKVLFISDISGNREIYVSDAGFTRVVNITNSPARDDWPAWSPDGSKIAFTSDQAGNFEVYSMNADGSGIINLTNHPADDGDGDRGSGGPSWSPDGRSIAFDSRRTGAYEVFSMAANGANVSQLTDGGTNLEPAWSPDGRLIAFASDRTGNRDLFVMASDGTNEVALTTLPGPSTSGRTGRSYRAANPRPDRSPATTRTRSDSARRNVGTWARLLSGRSTARDGRSAIASSGTVAGTG